MSKFFLHDSNMLSNRKIAALRQKFSHVGYSVWCMLLEQLAATESRSITLDEIGIITYAALFDVEEQQLCDIINFAVKIGLVACDGITISCPSLNARLVEYEKSKKQQCISDKRRKAINKRWCNGEETKEDESGEEIVTSNDATTIQNDTKLKNEVFCHTKRIQNDTTTIQNDTKPKNAVYNSYINNTNEYINANNYAIAQEKEKDKEKKKFPPHPLIEEKEKEKEKETAAVVAAAARVRESEAATADNVVAETLGISSLSRQGIEGKRSTAVFTAARQNNPQTPPPPPPKVVAINVDGSEMCGTTIPHDELHTMVATIGKEQIWLEALAMQHHLPSVAVVRARLPDFIRECVCQGKTRHESLQSVKSHFSNWLRVRLAAEKRQNYVTTTQTTSANKSTLTDASTNVGYRAEWKTLLDSYS